MNDDAGGRRMWPLRTGLLAIMAGTALLTAACSGGSGSPQVASLGTSSSAGNGGGSSASTVSNGNATSLLDEWASCIRGHGDPQQADPTIDAYKDIQITMPDNVSNTLSQEAHDSSGPCGSYLARAQTALGYRPPAPVSMATQLKYAECMRAHGVPLYPDPNGSSQTNLMGIGMPLTSPIFLNADKLCSRESGMQQTASGPPPPGIVQEQSAGVPTGTPPTSGGNKPKSGSGGSGGAGGNG
jgi:hypothetical protein